MFTVLRIVMEFYDFYSGTVFEGRYFTPEQTVLLIRGLCQAQSECPISP